VVEPALTIIEDALVRLVDRLRSAPESRLTRSDDRLGGASIAETCYELASWCACATPRSPDTRVVPAVPKLHPLTSGDQLLVLGRDLLGALAEAASDDVRMAGVRAELLERIEQLRSVC
jgi:hypothetical protein